MSKWTFSSEEKSNSDEDLEPMTRAFDYDRAFFVGFKAKPNEIYGFIFSIEDSEKERAIYRKEVAICIVDKKPMIFVTPKAYDFHQYLINSLLLLI